MKRIQLTQGQVALVDDEDFKKVNQFKWNAQKDGNKFYAKRMITINGKRTAQLMHMLIVGDNPFKLDIDHRDGDGLNNQKNNLRLCTHQQNMMNRKLNKNSSSTYKGVHYSSVRQKWQARIQTDGKRISLGFFNGKEDAARAYDAAAIEHHGEFFLLNF